MAALSHQSFANSTTPYWLSEKVEKIIFEGTPDVEVVNVGGELFGNGVSLSPSTWFNYPANGTIELNPGGDVIQIIAGDLYYNNSLIALSSTVADIADWYLYPALATVDLNTSVGINFDGRLLERDGTILRFGGVSIDDSEWAFYPAIQTVDMAGFGLSDVSALSSPSNLGLTVGSNYVLNAGTVATASRTFSVVTDTLNPLGSTKILLDSKNGSGGEIELVADSSITGSIGGKVSITAEGGSTGGLVYGGLVEITANTGGILPTGFTSAIKMSAASVESYAGAVSPFGSIAGTNFVYGTAGVNIVAGTPPLLPNVPGSVFLTGDIGVLGSSGGVRIKQGLSADFVTPLPLAGDLLVRGNPAGDKVQLANVRSIGMEGDITGLGSIGMTGSIGTVQTLTLGGTAAISGVSTINGTAYAPTQNWANFPALSNVGLAGFDLTAVDRLEFATDLGFSSQPGFLGASACPGTILTGGNGDLRVSDCILTSGVVANDMRLQNAFNFPGKSRIGVETNSFADVLAYITDVPVSRGSMSSSLTQGIVNTATPTVFTYTDFGTFVGLTESAGQITSIAGGEYLLTFCIQFARTGGGGGGGALAEAWIRINGVNVPNTNSRVALPSGSAESILTVPLNIVLAAGDYVEVVYCATNTNVVAEGIPARVSPFVAPAIPSIIVNIDQVA